MLICEEILPKVYKTVENRFVIMHDGCKKQIGNAIQINILQVTCRHNKQ